MYPPPFRSPSLRLLFQRKNERILCIAAISSQPVPSAVASPREAFCGLEDRDLIEFNDRRHWPKDDPGHLDCRWDADLQVRGQWRDEVDGAPVAPPGRHCAREPAHARFLGLDMQLLHRVRWLVRLMMKLDLFIITPSKSQNATKGWKPSKFQLQTARCLLCKNKIQRETCVKRKTLTRKKLSKWKYLARWKHMKNSYN